MTVTTITAVPKGEGDLLQVLDDHVRVLASAAQTHRRAAASEPR